MITERADPRRAQVAQVGVRKRSIKRPWFFCIALRQERHAYPPISAQRSALSPP